MARESYVYNKATGELVDAGEYYAKQAKGVKRSTKVGAPMLMRDITPFNNVAVDGREITSRSHKREMMKQHNLVEVGNDRPRPKKVLKPKGVRDSIKRSLQQLGVQ